MAKDPKRRLVWLPLLLFLLGVALVLHLIVAGLGMRPQDSMALPAAPAREAQTPLAEEEGWMLTLVNPWQEMPRDYAPALARLENGQAVDARCFPHLQAMLEACRAQGLSPVVCSAYRTWEKQAGLYQRQVDKLLARGYAQADAEREAGRAVARPGTSEHQLGLAVDIVDVNDQNLDPSQENTPVQQWLLAHSWEYGFILRYPSEKSDITGIIYEPWHYRYVGRPAARAIYAQGVTLEEYLQGSPEG